ncbi:hypothetical protein JYK21_07225 [Ralstonia pickettii]|nr:hypothetical protein [Ralstonia pickettii]
MQNKSNVRLPEKFWEDAQNKEHLTQLIVAYMDKNYPEYTVLKIRGRFAICDVGK